MKVTSSVGAAVSSQNKPTVESKGEGRWMAVWGGDENLTPCPSHFEGQRERSSVDSKKWQ